MQGCFESFPLMKFHDVALQKFCQISEWLEFYDTIDQRIHSNFEFGLYKYLPYPIINFHRLFAGTSSQDHVVQYPRLQYEVFTTKQSYENLIAIFLSGIHSSKRRYLNRDMVANELVPLLMQIISPELKIVGIFLCSIKLCNTKPNHFFYRPISSLLNPWKKQNWQD